MVNIKVTKKILEKYNIEVDSVKTGKECIFKIKSGEKYNLILNLKAKDNSLSLIFYIKGVIILWKT